MRFCFLFLKCSFVGFIVILIWVIISTLSKKWNQNNPWKDDTGSEKTLEKMFFLEKPPSEHHRKKCRSRLECARIWCDHFWDDIHLREIDPDMEDDHEKESFILYCQIFLEGFSMFIDITYTHEEDDRVHEKCPEPDRARMDPHTIESDRESIETECDEKHPSTRVGIESLDRIRETNMRLVYRKRVCSCKCEYDTEEPIDIHPFTEEEDTRENRRKRYKTFHWGNERYIPERQWLEVKILSEIVEESSSSNNPDKRWERNMTRYPLSDEKRNRDDDDRKRTNPCHHTCIERLEGLLRGNILESIQEWEDEESVEIDQGKWKMKNEEWKVKSFVYCYSERSGGIAFSFTYEKISTQSLKVILKVIPTGWQKLF